MQEGDTTYIMKKYFPVFLKSGPKRNQKKEEAAEIQKEHLAHIRWIGGQGFVAIAGPFGDDGEIRGILVRSVPSKTERKSSQLWIRKSWEIDNGNSPLVGRRRP